MSAPTLVNHLRQKFKILIDQVDPEDADPVQTLSTRIEAMLTAAEAEFVQAEFVQAGRMAHHPALREVFRVATEEVKARLSESDERDFLKQYITVVQETIDTLFAEVEGLYPRVTILEAEVEALKLSSPEAKGLIARQAVVTMERFMVVEALKSKRQARKKHVINLKALKKQNYGTPPWYTADMGSLMDMYKEMGTGFAHPVAFTAADLAEALYCSEDDEEEKALKYGFVKTLREYYVSNGVDFGGLYENSR
jgi:hypothetical protein